MPHNKSFTGVILAGGKSSRMGRNKALLSYGNRALIDHIKDELLSAGANSVIISGTVSGYGSVPDVFPERGPVGGIVSVLDHLANTPVLFTAVDCPKLDTGTIHILLEKSTSASACYFSGHPLPFLLNMTDAIAELVKHEIIPILSHTDISVQQLLHHLQASRIPTTPTIEQALINTNTPDEWLKVAG
jgi:molybdopterin-guanine dinucleotide biosynthesis protein A